MKNLIKKFSQKKWALGLGALVLVVAVLLLPQIALAVDIADWVASGLGHLALLIVNLLGSLVLLPLINLVVWILSYNSFLDNQAVIVGWPLVRDLCNMFFVVILLFIAFGTILNISNYSYKSTFFKLILMAVLINFSKTIMGLAIDFAQVIMLTFVNSFRDAAAVNLIHAFGIRDMLKLEVGNENFTNWEVVGKVILAVILLVVAIGLMLAYAAVLLWRIISLWVLIILSPLAFLLSAVPAGQKYASEIWTKFTEQLTTGVILAFFMWLSFSVLAAGYGVEQKTTSGSLIMSSDQATTVTGNAAQRRSVGGQANISSDIEWERLYTFIIAVALLLLALQYAQKAGGFAGSFAGKISGKLSALGTGAALLPYKGFQSIRNAGIDKLQEKTGVDLNIKRVWDRFQEARKVKKHREYDAGIGVAKEAAREGNYFHALTAGVTTGVGEHYDTYGYWKGLGRLVRPDLMGKRALENSNSIAADADSKAKIADEYERAAGEGGSLDKYLANRVRKVDDPLGPGEISAKRMDLYSEGETLRNRIREGKGTDEEKAADTERLKAINEELDKLEQEELNLRAHLTIADFSVDGKSKEDIKKFYEQKLNEVSKERGDIDNQITALEAKPDKNGEEEKQLYDLRKRKEVLEKLGGSITDAQRQTPEQRQQNIANIRNTAGVQSQELLKQEQEALQKRASILNGYSPHFLTTSETREREDLIKQREEEKEKLAKTLPQLTGEQKTGVEQKLKDLSEEIKQLSEKDAKTGLYHATAKQLSNEEREAAAQGEINKEKDEVAAKILAIDEQLKTPRFTQVEKENLKAKAATERENAVNLRIKSAKFAPIMGFEAQRARRALEGEEMKKVEGTESDTELLAMLMEAQARGNKARFAAICKKLANDYNDNEFLNHFGYDSTSEGMRQFFEKEAKGKAGFSDQEMLALANDVAYINESRNHYNTARMTEMKNGRWRWYTEQEHVNVAGSEIGKKAARDIANKLNRLAYGGETADGKYKMTGLGAAILRQQAAGWLQNERLIFEHLNDSVVTKLLEAEERDGAMSKALHGMTYYNKEKKQVRSVSEDFIGLFRRKKGSNKETTGQIAERVVRPNFGAPSIVAGESKPDILDIETRMHETEGIVKEFEREMVELNQDLARMTQKLKDRAAIVVPNLDLNNADEKEIKKIKDPMFRSFYEKVDAIEKDRVEKMKSIMDSQDALADDRAQLAGVARGFKLDSLQDNMGNGQTAGKVINEVTNQINQNISQPVNIKMAGTIGELGSLAKVGGPDFMDPQKDNFWVFRKLLNQLRGNMEEVAKSQNRQFSDFGSLGTRVKELDNDLPQSSISRKPAEVSDVIRGLHVTEGEIREIVQAFKGINRP